MNLVLRYKLLLLKLSAELVAECEQLVTRLNVWGAKEHQTNGTHAAISVTGFTFAGATQTTVGAAGGASALPATPTGYLTITIDTTEMVVPYYAKA